MRIKQHLVALRRVGHQPERPACAKLQVRSLYLVKHPAHHHAFLTPVKLEGLAVLKHQRHKRLDSLSRITAPRPNEVRHSAVATSVPLSPDLYKQRTRRAPAILVTCQHRGGGLR